jgi:hypothetical protein
LERREYISVKEWLLHFIKIPTHDGFKIIVTREGFDSILQNMKLLSTKTI